MKQKATVLARTYVRNNGQQSVELVKARGMYFLAVNGIVPDARRKLTKTDAENWYAGATYQLAEFI